MNIRQDILFSSYDVDYRNDVRDVDLLVAVEISFLVIATFGDDVDGLNHVGYVHFIVFVHVAGDDNLGRLGVLRD